VLDLREYRRKGRERKLAQEAAAAEARKAYGLRLAQAGVDPLVAHRLEDAFATGLARFVDEELARR
jgi:hypothetical protein